MSILSDRVLNMSGSATIEMSEKSRQLTKQGIDVINLSLGEPDFNTPDCIKEAGKKAIDDNKTHYTPVSGISELRQAIAEKLLDENGLDYTREQIVVSNGAKHSIANAVMALVNPGDEVILPAPYWVSYPEIVKLALGKIIEIDTTIEKEFKISPDDLERAITPQTKLLILNSPSNPTGSLYNKNELMGLAEVLEKHPHVITISDEIYEYINFEDKHESIAQFPAIKDRVVVVNGVSKGFAMTGWRIGYMAASDEIAKACIKLQGQFTSGPSSIAQWASFQAVEKHHCAFDDVKKMIVAFKSRRDLVKSLLDEIPGIKTYTPPGAFYIFPHIASYFGTSYKECVINTDFDFAMFLLKYAHVAIVPGSAFGNKRCVRVSYATSTEKLKEAIKRIKDALALLS